MTAFHTIAVPHEDILAGRLTLDVFAADLWEVHKRRAPDEYRDPTRFFQKTYQTEGLTNLLAVVEKRLRGEGGDPVIQIQTPFGGGKTHALIAMYHKAAEWEANRVIVVGTPMAPTDTLWGQIAQQLTGSRAGFEGSTAPGREALRTLLEVHQPLLVLMDEVLEYATKAAGVPVGSSTLSAQTLAFLQELTEAASTLERVCLAVTLPSSVLEHYDEGAEKLFRQLQKVAGRVEKIYTPVQEHEITQVIRRRLFSSVDDKRMQEVVGEFLDYAIGESLLPAGVEPSEYRQRFEVSYPFLPEVVDILYQRWGSFTSFQRTRGVLRLLSLVIHALKERELPYITLADFDLANQEVRRELLKHTGPEYDSVIAADVTGQEAGARKVDGELGAAYQGLRLGTRVATTIFLYSFSGGVERGATLGEVKRSATTTSNPASVVAEAVELLKGRHLFYVQQQSGKYFFTNQPNLNRILLTRMENIEPGEIAVEEEALLKTRVGGRRLKVFLWPTSDADIPDTPDLKLILLQERDDGLMEAILKQKGVTPRVHCNTPFFLVALENERPALEMLMRKSLAYETLAEDATLSLTADQQKEIKQGLKKDRGDLAEAVRRTYRQLFIPARSTGSGQARDGLKELDLGIPTYGEDKPLDEEVYGHQGALPARTRVRADRAIGPGRAEDAGGDAGRQPGGVGGGDCRRGAPGAVWVGIAGERPACIPLLQGGAVRRAGGQRDHHPGRGLAGPPGGRSRAYNLPPPGGRGYNHPAAWSYGRWGGVRGRRHSRSQARTWAPPAAPPASVHRAEGQGLRSDGRDEPAPAQVRPAGRRALGRAWCDLRAGV
jgi:hypothetical protein